MPYHRMADTSVRGKLLLRCFSDLGKLLLTGQDRKERPRGEHTCRDTNLLRAAVLAGDGYGLNIDFENAALFRGAVFPANRVIVADMSSAHRGLTADRTYFGH